MEADFLAPALSLRIDQQPGWYYEVAFRSTDYGKWVRLARFYACFRRAKAAMLRINCHQ